MGDYYVIEDQSGVMVSHYGRTANSIDDALKIKEYDVALGLAAVFTAIHDAPYEKHFQPRWVAKR